MNERLDSYYLFGCSTKETIDLGDGYKRWSLLEFGGPNLDPSRIGSKEPRGLYLPLDLLTLLYQRFKEANPQGTAIVTFDEAYDDLAYPPGTSASLRDELFESGEVMCDIFGPRRPNGQDPARKYLPELFDPAVQARLYADRTLHPEASRPNAPLTNGLYWTEDKHFRWQDWWAKV